MQSANYSLNTSKYKFIVFSVKKYSIPISFLAFTICLVIFSKSNLSAAKEGLLIWANSVVPSLLPFFIATELLGYTNIIYFIGNILNPIMQPLFHIPGIGSYAILMGFISGYPTGAKVVLNLRQNGLCTKVEAERMLAFSNNSGPLFILGTVGVSLFGNTTIGFLLLFTHILASLTVGMFFRFYKYKNVSYDSTLMHSSNIKNQNEVVNFSNLGNVLGNSIMSAIKTIVMIGGFVVLFSVILSILKNSNIINVVANILFPLFKILGIKDFRFVSGFICGIFELTNGISQVALVSCKQISINILLSSFLLGFGGFSVLLQVYSIISKSDISIKAYLLGKLLHGIIACFYTFICINCFSIFNFNF